MDLITIMEYPKVITHNKKLSSKQKSILDNLAIALYSNSQMDKEIMLLFNSFCLEDKKEFEDNFQKRLLELINECIKFESNLRKLLHYLD